MDKFLKTVELARALFDKEKHNPRCFVISVGYYKTRILGIGINSEKTNPTNLKNPLICRRTGVKIEKNGSCSELRLFKQLKNKTNIDFSKISIVNVRLTRDGRIGYSRCCNSCSSLISYCKPKNLFYTLDSDINNPQFEEYHIN